MRFNWSGFSRTTGVRDRISGDQSGICVTAIIGPGNACANVQGTFKESQTTGTDRVLTILFGPDSRFIEIHGTTGMA